MTASHEAELRRFLSDRLAEDEALARAAGADGGPSWVAITDSVTGYVEVDGADQRDVLRATVCFDEGSPSRWEAEHIARHDPARVLSECAARRRILDVLAELEETSTAVSRALLLALSAGYADHPDYMRVAGG